MPSKNLAQIVSEHGLRALVPGLAAMTTYVAVGTLCDEFLKTSPQDLNNLRVHLATAASAIITNNIYNRSKNGKDPYKIMRYAIDAIAGGAGGYEILGEELKSLVPSISQKAMDFFNYSKVLVGASVPFVPRTILGIKNMINERKAKKATAATAAGKPAPTPNTFLRTGLKAAGLAGIAFAIGGDRLHEISQGIQYATNILPETARDVANYLPIALDAVSQVPEFIKTVAQTAIPYLGARCLMSEDPTKDNQLVRYATQAVAAGFGLYNGAHGIQNALPEYILPGNAIVPSIKSAPLAEIGAATGLVVPKIHTYIPKIRDYFANRGKKPEVKK